MNLDELMAVWRSQDAAPLHDMNKNLLHETLRREQAEVAKQSRVWTRFGYVASGVLFVAAGLFLAVMIQRSRTEPNYHDVTSVWDYVVATAALVASMIVVWTVFALRRSQRAREQGFGDSLRDHLRRRLKQIDDEATGERRIGLISLAAGLMCAVVVPIVARRIAHVPVPYSEMDWPSPFWAAPIFGLLCLELFRWGPRRERRKNLSRKRRLEELLQELDGL
jgi:hypothetical protein